MAQKYHHNHDHHHDHHHFCFPVCLSLRWQRGIVVTALDVSTKLLYVEPCYVTYVTTEIDDNGWEVKQVWLRLIPLVYKRVGGR